MRKRRLLQFATCLLAAPISGAGIAADLSGYLVLTSDYVYRGVTQSDGHAAGQLGLDLAFESGLYAGVWVSSVDIDNGPDRHRDLQTNYYLGYGFDLSDQWRLNTNIVAYTYPGTEGDIDYDYTEYSIGVNYSDRIWFEYAYSPDIYNTGLSTQNFDIYAEWQFASDWVLGTGAGYYDVSSLAGRSYGHWQLGISRPVGRFDFDLRYHDSNRWVPIFSTPDRADARLVLSITLPF
ncbi:MAG: TorF family putative porin [Gammaproteobacteria bacterium]|nr:TorF family putative porin [Gammaproteobacteria bacterium]MDH3435302.1 TorF family putative porin [Gammaproteobacteria bacterium]